MNVTLFGKRIFTDVIKLRTRVGIHLKTGVLIRWGNFGHKQRDIQGRTSFDNQGRDWSDVSMSLGMQRTASNHQKLERSKKGSSSRTFKESIAQMIP